VRDCPAAFVRSIGNRDDRMSWSAGQGGNAQ
jgi:hypothetical protein